MSAGACLAGGAARTDETMERERWRQISGIFESALARDPAERARLIEERCAGDEGLRREVEAMVAAHEGAGGIVDAPAYERAAPLLGGEGAGSLEGKTLGRYRVLSRLGAGGMGEVYLAEDTSLGRRVALKLLPPGLTADETYLRRFRQEARAASSLNHPGILTVYEIDEAEGAHFIATEYVEGETLRERLRRAGLAAGEALDIAVKAADALDAAHRAGVVHRDVKPENLMLRPDGYVKVLDFGLAKLTRAGLAAGGAMSAVDTEPGVLMGTVAYMSPEQAAGRDVDARTDVWSLAVVLYEMLAGRPPFEGETPSHCLASILKDEPPPLEVGDGILTSELQSVLGRALSKDREGRYGSAKEFADELRALRDGLGANASGRTTAEALTGGGRPDTAGRVGRSTDGHARARTASLRTRRVAKAPAAAALVLAAGAAAFGLYQFFNGRTPARPAAPPFLSAQLTRLTNHGSVRTAALSPDGQYAAYALAALEGQSLWVKHVATSSAVQIAPASPDQYHGLTFSPDGGYLYALVSEGSRGDVSLRRVPVLGGSTVKLPVVSDTPVTFSPDGARFAFVEVFSSRGESILYVAGADGTGRRPVATLRQPDFFAAYPGGPAWSPDGAVIASPAGLSDSEGHYMGVVAVGLAGGAVKPIGSRRWASISHVAWLAGGRGLVLTARDEPAAPSQVWHLTYPEGEARKITNDLNDYGSVSVTADGGALAAVQSNIVSTVWVVPKGDASRARKVATEAGEIGVITWTPDGRIAYRSNDYRNAYIGVMSADGAGLRKVAFDARIKEGLTVSPDGRHAVFASDREGRYNLWRADVETGEVTRLTSGDGEIQPAYTPDGRWIVYQHGYGLVKPTLWKIPAAGGESVRLTETHAAMPSVSADGKLIAYTSLQKIGGETLWRVAVIPSEGGQPVKVLDLGVAGLRLLRWTPDGRALAYADDRRNASDVWIKPLDGGPARPVTDFGEERILSFDWSRDGRSLAVARGADIRDVVLIKDLK